MQSARRLSLLNLPSLNLDADIAASMSRIVETSGLSRAEAVDRLNEAARRYGVRLCGGNAEALTLATLEKWLNPNESKNVPSTRALNIFCHVFGTPEPLDLLARSHGQGWRVDGKVDKVTAQLDAVGRRAAVTGGLSGSIAGGVVAIAVGYIKAKMGW